MCFISLVKVAGALFSVKIEFTIKADFGIFIFFMSIWITALVSLRHILPVSKQVEKISPVISAPVCTYHTHILPHFFPAKFSDTSFLRIIFGLNQNHFGSTAIPTLCDLFRKSPPSILYFIDIKEEKNSGNGKQGKWAIFKGLISPPLPLKAITSVKAFGNVLP